MIVSRFVDDVELHLYFLSNTHVKHITLFSVMYTMLWHACIVRTALVSAAARQKPRFALILLTFMSIVRESRAFTRPNHTHMYSVMWAIT